jgi:hypothetical protein
MMTTLLSPEIATVDSLTERCDRCGVAAKVEVVLASGGELAFCGHHANKLATEFPRIAAQIRIQEGFAWAGKVPTA